MFRHHQERRRLAGWLGGVLAAEWEAWRAGGETPPGQPARTPAFRRVRER